MGGVTEESVVNTPTTPNSITTNVLDQLGGLSLNPTAPTTRVTSPQTTSPLNQFASPQNQFIASPPPVPTNNMDDLLGIFGGGGGQANAGFGGTNVWNDTPQQNGSQPAPTKNKPTNEDILGLF